MRLKLFIITLCLCILPLQVFGAVSSRIVAVVNGEMISSLDLEKKVKPLLLQNNITVPSDNQTLYDQINREVLNKLIEESVLLQAAKAQNINIPDEVVQAQLAQEIAQSQLSETEFYKQASKAGFTPAMLFQSTKNNIIIQQLITFNVAQKAVVTPSEVEAYYNQNMNDLSQTTSYQIALIVYPNEADAKKYSSQIAQKQISFSNAVKAISVGPNPQNGGDLGTMKAEDMAPELLQVVENLEVGTHSGLIPMAFNQAQVLLIDKKEVEIAPSLDYATRQRIENMIREPRLQNLLADYMDQLYKKAIIDIRY